MGRSYGGHEVSPSAHMLAYSKTIDSRLQFMESFALQKKEGALILESVQVWSLPLPLLSLNCGKGSVVGSSEYTDPPG